LKISWQNLEKWKNIMSEKSSVLEPYFLRNIYVFFCAT
jgi:hypothetical protein